MAFTYSGNLTGQASGSSQAISVESKTANGAGTNTDAIHAATDGNRNAIGAESSSSAGYATIYARNTATSGSICIQGVADGGEGVVGEGSSRGVRGTGGATGVSGVGNTGVSGSSTIAGGNGVAGSVSANSGSAYAIFGYTTYPAAYAGYFSGKVFASSFSATSKAFLIDHPGDPENKLLRHSSVESSERKNIYDGLATADAKGELAVQMPDYFDALNEDFRYQLTAVGGPAPNLHVKQELTGRRFVIAGAAPGQKVCWMITGNRKDAAALADPLIVEEEKLPEHRGLYLCPEAHGQPREKGMAKLPELPPEVPSSLGSHD